MKYITSGFYHVYNRGVEKRDVFIDGADHFRFILGMKELNTVNSVGNLYRVNELSLLKKTRKNNRGSRQKDPLVKFVAYALMPNHFHFIVQQVKDRGISKFMQKLGTSYTKYFNKRYDRSGVLFQGVFKAKYVSTDEYLLHLSRYIHLNPLSLSNSDWVSQGVRDKKSAYKLLIEYKWHSLPFWLEDRPNLLNLHPQIVLEQFSSRESYKKFLLDWTKYDMEEIREIIIE